jgi:hypothetical protein
MQDDARHLALVPLSEAIDVKELEPGPAGRGKSAALAIQGPDIKEPLRFAVGIQRLQVGDLRFVIVIAKFACPVGRGTAGVDEGDAMDRGVAPERLRVLQIHQRQVLDIQLSRIRAGPEVNDA